MGTVELTHDGGPARTAAAPATGAMPEAPGSRLDRAPAPAEPAPRVRSSPLRRLGYLLLFHVVPAVFFAIVAAARLGRVRDQLMTAPPLDTLADVLRFGALILDDLLVVGFIGLAAVLFAIRRRPVRRTSNPAAIVVALLGTFSLIALAAAPTTLTDTPIIVASILLLLAGNVGAIFALWQLGRNVSITPAARRLVTSGLYGRVRHPLYAAEITAGLGALLPVLSPGTLAIFVAFVGFQVWRTHYEEALLGETFPEYAAYRQRVPRLLPRLFRPGAPSERGGEGAGG